MNGSVRILFGALALLAALSTACAFEFLPTPCQLDVTYSERKGAYSEWNHVFVFQDRAGQDLVGTVTTDDATRHSEPRTRILLFDSRLGTAGQINRQHPVNNVYGRDVDGDGRQELVLVNHADSVCTVEIITWPEERAVSMYSLDCRNFPERKNGIWDISIGVGPLVPGVLKDRPALLLEVKSGFGLRPRGLILIDPLLGTELWHHWLPDVVMTMGLMEIQGDSLPEIVFGCNAPDNGLVWDNLPDNLSYLGVVNARGQRLWMRSFPGPFSTVSAFPLRTRAGEAPVIFAVFAAGHPDAGRSRLLRVDARSGETLATVYVPGTTTGCAVYPWGVDKNGKRTFLIAVRNSGLFVYDENLRLLDRTRRLDGVWCIGDLDGDGQNELVGSKAGLGTTMLDHTFRVMASTPFQFSGGVIVQRDPSSSYPHLWGESADGIYRLEISTVAFYWWKIGYRALLLILVPFLLAWGIQAFAQARQSTRRAEIDKARFEAWAAVATKIAHDIRTPLSVLRLSAQNLEQELETKYREVPEELRHYFQTFSDEADRLSNIARSFMTLARTAPPVLEPTDLAGLLHRIVERRPHPPGITVELCPDGAFGPVRLDTQQMIILFENLLLNSYRAMKNGGTLTIRLFKEQDLQRAGSAASSQHRTAADFAVVEIADTGCGIAPEDLPRVFDPYFSRSEGGTGIGLVIAKKIVEEHGGTISLASTPGIGTTATIRLPLATEKSDETEK